MTLFQSVLTCILLTFAVSGNAQKLSVVVTDTTKNFEALHQLPNNRIIAVDYQNGRLYDVKQNGEITTIITRFKHLVGGGVGNDGTFYFSDIVDGIIYRLNADNSYTKVAEGFRQPISVLPTADDDKLLVNSYADNAVYEISIADKSNKVIAEKNELNGPDAMLYDDDGSILVANFNNCTIHRIAESGSISKAFELPEKGYMGYLAKNGKLLYAPAISAKKIYRIDLQTSEMVNFSDPKFVSPNGILYLKNRNAFLISDGSTLFELTDF